MDIWPHPEIGAFPLGRRWYEPGQASNPKQIIMTERSIEVEIKISNDTTETTGQFTGGVPDLEDQTVDRVSSLQAGSGLGQADDDMSSQIEMTCVEDGGYEVKGVKP